MPGLANAPVAEGLWNSTVGERPHTVAVFERVVGGMVYVRWTKDRKPFPRSLNFKVRDERGRIRKRDQQRALVKAREVARQLADGLDPEEVLRAPERPEDQTGDAQRYATLRQALDRALRVPTGMWVNDTRHRRDMRQVSGYLISALGPAFSMGDLLPTTAETVWRHVLETALEDGECPSGHRKAEKAVQLLYTVAHWIYDRWPQAARREVAMSRWRERLRQEWVAAFARDLDDAKRLRHPPAEAARLFHNIEKADPRVRMVIEIGAELRAGQVCRSRRSQLDLDEVGAFGVGRMEILGSGRKRGEVVHLTPEQRKYIDFCLDEGHLHELERAFRAGEIDDYFLWQKGKLRRDPETGHRRMQLNSHLTTPGPMDSGSLIELFREFESNCGVEHVTGRSFYGLRRVLTDIAPEYTDDPRALDRLTGHDDPATRERRYQDRMREEDRGAAAVARREMRADLTAGELPGMRTRSTRRRRAGNAAGPERVRAALQRLTGVDVPDEQIEVLLEELGLRETG